ELKDLYQRIETAGVISSSRTYALNSAYKKRVYTGISYTMDRKNGRVCVHYNYNVYQYPYLEWLEKIYI
ncbi:MAG: hypothetical protein NC489_35370, partial [Ruminococcus flavefaciens]|nr:hypothetical protein [Ruminococcus flavefaciens]